MSALSSVVPSRAPLLTVVVPTRDEETNVHPLVSRLRGALASVDYEILFVDDSDDPTPARVAALARHDPRLDLIHREGGERKGGLSTAVLLGIRRARGEFVCVMDADLQHPPEMVLRLLREATSGADVVVASRYVSGGRSGGLDGLGRRIVSRAATIVARGLFTEARCSTDPLSGFFVCRRSVIDGVEFRPVGFKILLELLVCVPGLEVSDQPLDFAPREAGSSKATLAQGMLFLNHLRSLFLDVQGSARRWKFILVGLSGLGILLPLVAFLSGWVGLSPVPAFIPAYALSLAWNTTLNRLWTFADQRRGHGEGAARYLERAAISASPMFVAYATLTAISISPVAAASVGAVVAMGLNAAGSWKVIRQQPHLWSDMAPGADVQTVLTKIGAQLGAGRCYMLSPDGAVPAVVPAGTVDQAVAQRRAVLFVQAAGHQIQRRWSIETQSTLVVPVVRGDNVVGVLVCERRARQAFTTRDLGIAVAHADALGRLIDSPRTERALTEYLPHRALA